MATTETAQREPRAENPFDPPIERVVVTESTALARRSPFDGLLELERHLDALERVAQVLCKASILPKDMQAPANLKLVLLQGLAMGFDPVQAIRASYIITSQSQPPRVGYYVEALVALVRRSEVCRFFRVEEATADRCRVVCARRDEAESVLHVFEMTIEQARKANLDKKWERGENGRGGEFVEKHTWKAAPADMLRNRICGRAVKSVFQDVVYGMSTPDEIDDAQEAAESSEPSPRNIYVAAPIATPAAPSSRGPVRTATPAAEPIDAEEVHDTSSGDLAWDELLAEIATKSGTLVNGWLPDDLLEEFARRTASAGNRAELNALSAWIGAATARTGRSKVCGDVATKMRDMFNGAAAEMKKRATPAKDGAA